MTSSPSTRFRVSSLASSILRMSFFTPEVVFLDDFRSNWLEELMLPVGNCSIVTEFDGNRDASIFIFDV